MPDAPAYLVRQSGIHGTGVFAARDLAFEEEIVWYEGALITHAEAGEREDTGHTFLFTLNEWWVIDGGVGGSDARFINHSCDPNCEAAGVDDDEDNPDPAKERIVIQALRPIRAGEELTYDYQLEVDEPITDEDRVLWACRCGSPKCRGVMLKEVGSEVIYTPN
ncbi:MAG TPA: SET domain-containing protein-lysine N-methyltransferase [Verrucomicrobiae bacterium]|nr:SET domain-containing protein-lysine N-methyltransferase [Verrucomicrobiae bacterium]